MRTRHGISALAELPRGCVLSIGNFDGVHLGHQRLIAAMRSLAEQRHAAVVLVTFEPHPLTVLRPHLAPPRLSGAKLKTELLLEAGVDQLLVLPPTEEVLGLTAERFWALIRDSLAPTHVVEGRSFNFGKDRGGTIERLRGWCGDAGIGLTVLEDVEAVLCDRTVVPVSSTLVRWLVAHGRMRDVIRCTGRPYAIEGVVVAGFQRGRTIGVPTANLRIDDQLVPGFGVYGGTCRVGGRRFPVALSVGILPTFGDQVLQIEAHLLGFDGDLYGQTLRVELHEWIRGQLKFPSLEALKRQLARDLDDVRRTTPEAA
jgi:riboflavin kinase/FMN adenylyltransferase